MRRILIVVGLLALLLAGCASAPESTPLPTSTFTSKPTSTRRIFPSPTRYKTQTTTPSFTPTITRTPHPTSTLPPFPTPKGGYVKYLGVESISPTGKWIAWWIDCREQTDNPYNQCLEFINNDGTLTWTVGDFGVDLKSPTGSYTHVAHWSVDNRFVFLVSYPMEVEWIFRPAVHKIIKYSLVNGMSTYILTPREDPNNSPFYLEYNYGFSNDSRWLVYADLNGLSANFTLLNLFTGEVNYFSVIVKENAVIGDISWSPNDQYFVFSAAENIIAIGETDDFSVFRVGVDDLSLKRVYYHGDKFLTNPEWVSENDIIYETWFGDQQIILNIETGAITEVEQ